MRPRNMLAACLLVAQSAAFAIDPAIVGKWKMEYEGETSQLEIKADGSAIMEGEKIQIESGAGKLKMTYQVGAVIEAPYTVAGNALTIDLMGDKETWTRVGPAPAAAPTATPAPTATKGSASPPATPQAAVLPVGESANMMKKPDEGFDLALPGDFHIVKQQGGMYVLGSNVTPGLILVIPSPALSKADLDKGGREGLQTDEVQMAATAPGKDVELTGGGTAKVVDVSGMLDGANTQGILGGFMRAGGGGVVLLAATTPESWPKLKPFAEQAMKGVRVYAPQISDRLAKARQALAGHSLVYAFNNSTVSQNSSGYYTGSAVNSFKAWHCCASGRGRYEGARSSSFQGGGVIGSSESGPSTRDGNWVLNAQGDGFLLCFKFDSGESATWTVTVDANENVFVDGTKVKVTVDSICERL